MLKLCLREGAFFWGNGDKGERELDTVTTFMYLTEARPGSCLSQAQKKANLDFKGEIIP